MEQEPISLKREVSITASLLVLLIVSVAAVGTVWYYSSRATGVVIPHGYTPLTFATTLTNADENNDGYINTVDFAIQTRRQADGVGRLVGTPKFGGSYNALTTSFTIENFDTDVALTLSKLDKDKTTAELMAKEIIAANESAIPQESLALDVSNSFEQTNTLTSADQAAQGGSSSSESFGRTVIPTVLGTVSSYTGSSEFNIPIEVPKGAGGLAPELGLSYSSQLVDDQRGYNFEGKYSYTPTVFGHGWSLTGEGSISLDTRGEKELFSDVVNGKTQIYHRFIMTLPNGISAELKYNPENGRWVSLPQSFLKIEHKAPEVRPLGSNFDYDALGQDEWIVRTPDGTSYHFGDDNLSTKLNPNGSFKNATPLYHKDDSAKPEKDRRVIGAENANSYVEFDKSDLCTDASATNPCLKRREEGKPVLMVTKWHLRKIVTVDGKNIDYRYDVQQRDLSRYMEKRWNNNLTFVTSATYPKEISWNQGTYRVRFERDQQISRADMGVRDHLPYRIRAITVETTRPTDPNFVPIRSYALSYYGENDSKLKEVLGNDVENNPYKLSFITSVQEKDSKGAAVLPAVKFKYAQVSFKDDPRTKDGKSSEDFGEPDSIYLSSIQNGYGGETKFSYVPYTFRAQKADGDFDGDMGLRVRVSEKTVFDKTSSPVRSYKEVYQFSGQARAFAPEPRMNDMAKRPVGFEFLGFPEVEVTMFDYDGKSVLSHNKTTYYQVNEDKIGDKTNCVEPNPAKGKAKESITYDRAGKIIARSVPTYHYRQYDASAQEFVDGLDPNNKCDRSRVEQPVFLYTKRTDSYAFDTSNNTFVPPVVQKIFTADESLLKTTALKKEVRTAVVVDSIDLFGNTTKSTEFADVDMNSGSDLRADDTRYSYSYFLQNPSKWMLALPYLSYSSDKSTCMETDKSCQFGRTEQLFDGKKYQEIPERPWVTESNAYRTKDSVATIKQEYDEYGNIIKIFGPEPNQKTSEKIVQIGETIYDPYYHTLVKEQINALGHKTLFDEYDHLLQLPGLIKKQIQKDSERYMVARYEYDSIGRLVKEFSPDPEQVGKTLLVPSTINGYFISDTAGLRVRSMKVSNASEGIHYMTNDTFYDGTGKAVQSQMLSSVVGGKPKRLVTHSLTNAAGESLATYDVQEESPIEVTADTINQIEPIRVEVTAPVMGRVTYDDQGRATSTTQIDSQTSKSYVTSRTNYLLNAVKNINQKGVVVVSNIDGLGRALTTITYSTDAQGNPLEASISKNTYDKPMIDKPTSITVSSLRPIDGTGSITTSFTYDDAGQLLTVVDPSSGPYRAEYDVLGNKIREESQSGEITTYSYDLLGRPLSRSYEGIDGKKSVLAKETKRTKEMYTYDEGTNALGKLSKVDNTIGSESYTYDGGQRIVQTKKSIFDIDRSFTTSYNKFSQLRDQKMPDESNISYGYDAQGRPQTIKLNGRDLLTGKTYDKYGKELSADAVGSQEAFNSTTLYDGLGRLKDITVVNKAAFGDQVYQETLRYNDVMEIEHIDEKMTPSTHHYDYTYNAFSQLLSASSDLYNTSYTYDVFGRITKKDEGREIGYEYDSQFPAWAPKTLQVAGIVATPTPTIPKTVKTPIPPTPGPSVEVGTGDPTDAPTPSPTAQPTKPNTCSFDATAFVKECLNADCTESAPLAAFDGDTKFGLANEAQRGDGSDLTKDKPVQTFNKDNKSDQVGLNIQHFDDFRSALKNGNFPESVKLYYDADNWTIVRREAKGLGAPETFAPKHADNVIGDFTIQCNINVNYGWYLRKKGNFLTDLAGKLAQKIRADESPKSAFTMDYTKRGALKEDLKTCYDYNREGQLMALKRKEKEGKGCGSDIKFTTVTYFYYDHTGALVLTEDYKAGDLTKALKKTYLFGDYEEVYE